MIKTYSQPNRLKVITVIGISFFNFIVIYLFISIFSFEYNFFEKIFYLFSCVSFWILVNYGLIEQLVEKVTISDTSLTHKTILKNRSLLLENIKGYQLKNKNIYLYPKDEKTKGISFSDNLVDGEEKILDYFVTDNSKTGKNSQ